MFLIITPSFKNSEEEQKRFKNITGYITGYITRYING